jgi:predicted Zn-dependent peptidase
MTIGKELSHIENASLQDVKDFFFTHYRPKNAILVVAGNVTTERGKRIGRKMVWPYRKRRNLQPGITCGA